MLSASATQQQSAWVVLLVAGITAAASVVAAIISGIFAWKARRADSEAQRARDLENRISERKYELYKPMIDFFRDVVQRTEIIGENSGTIPQEQIRAMLANFSTWIGVYGSDGAVQAFHNFMQTAFHGPPPMEILLRLYSDFLMETRKDIGYPDTSLAPEYLLGLRVTDIYEHPDATRLSFEKLCDKHNWRPPWYRV